MHIESDTGVERCWVGLIPDIHVRARSERWGDGRGVCGRAQPVVGCWCRWLCGGPTPRWGIDELTCTFSNSPAGVQLQRDLWDEMVAVWREAAPEVARVLGA